VLERDLDACALSGVRNVILFDVDVPTGGKRNIESPEQVRALTDHIRERLGADALVCIDQEGGSVSRLNERWGMARGVSASEFARLGPGARRDEAERQAVQLADLGIDVDFSPCVDLEIEAASSIIAGQGRSFGPDAEIVVECAREVIRALGERGVGACLKHFPGHGSARGDTHEGLVDITETARRELELEPYRVLLAEADGTVGVMVAHVMDSNLDPEHPASLSSACVEGLLRGELGFSGVVVTDSLDMRAITNRYGIEEACVRALDAGADMVIDGFNLDPSRGEHPAPAIVRALRDAMAGGRLSEARIAESLGRVERFRGALRRKRLEVRG
jgi:beta-N-acetylhexosaminidase